tara:strand:+ start:267 stop:443 length:177 start_codon:yes stop_codon:yes gene_type:complete
VDYDKENQTLLSGRVTGRCENMGIAGGRGVRKNRCYDVTHPKIVGEDGCRVCGKMEEE